jgi:hypothetical protein
VTQGVIARHSNSLSHCRELRYSMISSLDWPFNTWSRILAALAGLMFIAGIAVAV